MAEIKPIRPGAPALTARSAQVTRPDPSHRSLPSAGVEERPRRELSEVTADPVAQLVTDFAAVPPRTASWLSDPRLVATLQEASEALAPGGIAEDPADRYAASVIETHLVARRRLMKLANAMLKT